MQLACESRKVHLRRELGTDVEPSEILVLYDAIMSYDLLLSSANMV